MFNPNEHLMQLKGKDYLAVKWRLVWFRDDCPHGTIKTEMLRLDLDKNIAVFKATVEDGEGGVGEGHGSECIKDFGDFIEKAETKAIGRALASLGYGTQFAPELEEGERIVDSPSLRRVVDASQSQPQSQQPSNGTNGVPSTGKPVPASNNAQSKAVQEMLAKAKMRASAGGFSWDELKKEKGLSDVPDSLLQVAQIALINGRMTEKEKGKQPVEVGK